MDYSLGRRRPGLWWSLVVIAVAGVLMLSLRQLIPGVPGWTGFNASVQDLLRDIGVAFVVSSVVGGLFEVYRNLHHQIQSMQDVVDALMVGKLTKQVWFELENLIDAKIVLRKDLRIRIAARRKANLQPYEAQLRVELEYGIQAIGKSRDSLHVRHDLDYHLARPDLDLPRFERLTIVRMEETNGAICKVDEEVYADARLAECVKDGALDIKQKPLRANESLRIRLTREEVVHIPGSYNLYTTEFTKGLRVLIAECPDATRVELSVRPQGENLPMTPVGNEWSTEQLILPGQGIELKFLVDGEKSKCTDAAEVRS